MQFFLHRCIYLIDNDQYKNMTFLFTINVIRITYVINNTKIEYQSILDACFRITLFHILILTSLGTI